jgi:hypothetical protein
MGFSTARDEALVRYLATYSRKGYLVNDGARGLLRRHQRLTF